MKSNLMKFAKLYTPEFVERVISSKVTLDLTPGEYEKAKELTLMADSMAKSELADLSEFALTMFTASQEESTGYFDQRLAGNMSLVMHERLNDANELLLLASDMSGALRDYDLSKLAKGSFTASNSEADSKPKKD